MSNFSKFLHSGEEIKKIVRTDKSSHNIYITIILLATAFFMLFPMWQAGRQGFWLWSSLVVFLIILLFKQILNKESLYLLTSRRIIYLQIVSKDKYKYSGSIRLREIDNIKQSGHSLAITANRKKYYLVDLKEPDKLYQKLQAML